MKVLKIIKFIFIALIIIYIILLTNNSFIGAEHLEYFGYIKSIVHDFDLNIVNNFEDDIFYYGISKTYNLADFHQHGGIIIWVPFYIFGNILKSFLQSLSSFLHINLQINFDSIPETVLCLSTPILGITIIILIFWLLKKYYNKKIIFSSLFLITFGIPFILYSIYLPGQQNIVAAFFGVLLIIYINNISDKKDVNSWFFLGILFSLCFIVKLDLWFHIITISTYLIYIFIRDKDLKSISKICISFSFGILPCLSLKIINSYIMYGVIKIGELSTINTSYSIFPDLLFSEYRGMFFISPILYACVLGASLSLFFVSKNYIIPVIFGIKKINISTSSKDEDFTNLKNTYNFKMLMLCFLITFIIKTIIRSRGFAWGGDSLNRAIIADFPLFVFLLCELFSIIKLKNKGLIIALILLLPLLIWTILNSLLFHFGPDDPINLSEKLSLIIWLIKSYEIINIFYMAFIGNINTITEKAFFLAITLILLSLIFIIYKIIKNKIFNKTLSISLKKTMTIFILYSLFFYLITTILNISFNQINVDKMKKQNFFSGIEISNPEQFAANENMNSMTEMIHVYNAQKKYKKVKQIEKTLQEYRDKVYK